MLKNNNVGRLLVEDDVKKSETNGNSKEQLSVARSDKVPLHRLARRKLRRKKTKARQSTRIKNAPYRG